MVRLNRETPSDQWEVEALFDLCFSPGRRALSSYRLRHGVKPVAKLCLVARDDQDILAGAIRFWPVRVGQQRALLLGPIAVHPTHQGEGLGAMLMAQTLGQASSDWSRVILVGDGPYYGRFGFEILPGVDMPAPTDPGRVLGFALQPGAWDGVQGKVSRWGQSVLPNE